jgi:hypothetical protein
MSRAFGCRVCGEDDCGRHRDVLTAATLLNVCVLAGAGLLIGVLVWSAASLAE